MCVITWAGVHAGAPQTHKRRDMGIRNCSREVLGDRAIDDNRGARLLALRRIVQLCKIRLDTSTSIFWVFFPCENDAPQATPKMQYGRVSRYPFHLGLFHWRLHHVLWALLEICARLNCSGRSICRDVGGETHVNVLSVLAVSGKPARKYDSFEHSAQTSPSRLQSQILILYWNEIKPLNMLGTSKGIPSNWHKYYYH